MLHSITITCWNNHLLEQAITLINKRKKSVNIGRTKYKEKVNAVGGINPKNFRRLYLKAAVFTYATFHLGVRLLVFAGSQNYSEPKSVAKLQALFSRRHF